MSIYSRERSPEFNDSDQNIPLYPGIPNPETTALGRGGDTIEETLAELQEELLSRIDLLRLLQRKNETLEKEKKDLKINLREVELKIGNVLKKREQLNQELETKNLAELERLKEQEKQLSELMQEKESLQTHFEQQIAQSEAVKLEIVELQQKIEQYERKIDRLNLQLKEEESRPLEENNNAYFIQAIIDQVGGEQRMRVISDREVEKIVLKQPEIQHIALQQISTLLKKIARRHKSVAIGRLKLHSVSLANKRLKFRQGFDRLQLLEIRRKVRFFRVFEMSEKTQEEILSQRTVVASFIKWRKVYMSRVQRRQNLEFAVSILERLSKHSLKHSRIRFFHHIQNIHLNHQRKLKILPAIINRMNLRCNVAFFRLLGHCNTMKKRAEIFQKVASALRERSLQRSFLKVKKFALKKQFKDNSLKIHAFCLLRNYVGNAHISMTKKLTSDLRQKMAMQLQLRRLVASWQKVKERSQIQAIKIKISEEEAKIQECNSKIDAKKHWFKAWARLLSVFGAELEQKRMCCGFSRIKKYVVAKEVMVTKLIAKIGSANLPEKKKASAFGKLRQNNLRGKYRQRKQELGSLEKNVDLENQKIASIRRQLDQQDAESESRFHKNLINRIFFRLRKTALYQFLHRVRRFQHEDQKKRISILRLNMIAIRRLRMRFSGLLNISKEEGRVEKKYIRAKKHLQKTKLTKMFNSMRHFTFSSRKGTIILRSLLILKAKEILKHSVLKLRSFLVDFKLRQQKEEVEAEKCKILEVKDRIQALKEVISSKEEQKRVTKKKFEKSLVKKTLARIVRSAKGKQLQAMRLLLTFKKKSDRFKNLLMAIVSITNSKLEYGFRKFQGKCLFEKERFLIEEIRQIREDYAELVSERQGLNTQLIAFVKEKEMVEMTLPKELRKLRKIKKRVENLAGGDEIFYKYRMGLLSFYTQEWLVQYRRRAVMRKLLYEERPLDLSGYFLLWAKNSKRATKKLESVEKWRKFVTKKELQIKRSTVGTMKEFVLVKDQKILSQKIQQTKNDCQKTLHVVHQTKVHGMNDVLRKIFIGNQVQHMKDIFVLFKETKREEAILRFFGKVMTKFKKRRVSAAIFRQLKRKLEIKRLITVAEQRQQKREKTFIFQLLKFNIWFQRQKRLALNNLLKNTLRPFSRVASESFAMIKYFVNPDQRTRMHAEFKKLNLGIFQIHLLMENFKKLQSAHFFARIRELNDTKAATRRAYPLLAKLRNMVTRRILLGVREISAYVSLVDKIEGQNVRVFLFGTNAKDQL